MPYVHYLFLKKKSSPFHPSTFLHFSGTTQIIFPLTFAQRVRIWKNDPFFFQPVIHLILIFLYDFTTFNPNLGAKNGDI